MTEDADQWEHAAMQVAAKLNAANEILEALLEDIRRRRSKPSYEEDVRDDRES